MHARPGRPTRLAPRRSGGVAALALLALVAGCARGPAGPRPAPPSAPPPITARPHPGYDARRDSLDAIDPEALVGRRIVLDPGHGGVFPGSLGVNGLTEAAVNLDVALALRDLLVARGARVTMTRETDRDFLAPADSTLRADLAERVRLANTAEPELFVSIHHNADARGSHDVNEIQTYYRTDDDGPSLEAARAVHRALTRNLSIAARRIIPGNYFVLRHSTAPAILTESSYLTNPDVEARLALPEKRRLEAEALFLGIAAFFARGAPEVVAFGPAGAADGVFHDAFPVLAARVRGAFDRVELRVDGAPVAAEVAGDSIGWRAARPYAAGAHEATLRVALDGAGSAPLRRLAFRVESAPERLALDFPGQPPWDGEQPVAVRVRVFGVEGTLHRDSVAIRVRETGPHRLSPVDTVVIARDGVAWAYLRRATHGPLAGATDVRVRAALLHPQGGSTLEAGARLHGRPRGDAGPRVRTGFVTTWPGGERVRDTADARDADPATAWINRDGFAVLACDSLGRVAVPALRGYRAVAPDTTWPPRFAAIAGGALHGRRIALDAEGGGDADGGSGPSGTRAADLNLDVARALAGFLTAAGAEVTLVRDGDRARPDLERVRAAEAAGAERYLRIGHRAAPPVLGHWFGSAAGRAWALRTFESLAALGLPAPPVAEEPQFTLQQSSCPALYVSVARVDSAAGEERALAPGARRAEAYALFLALAREFAPAAEFPADSLEVRDAVGRPVPDAAVRLGGALVLGSDALGRVRFARTEPGPLEAAVVDPRVKATRILLDSARGVVLTGPPAR